MRWECDSFRLGIFRNRRKGSAAKNLAGALHAERVVCTLSVAGEVKMEIPGKRELQVPASRCAPNRVSFLQGGHSCENY